MNISMKPCRVLKNAVFFCLMFFVACNDAGESVYSNATIGKDKLISINKYMNDKDFDLTRHFVKRKSWRMTLSESGYYYEIFEEGTGEQIKSGSAVTYSHSVSLLDGTLCFENRIKTFIVDGSDEISGFHEAVKSLKTGGKARFIFPPHLGYGLQGDLDKIPPRSVLVYNVQIIKSQSAK